MNNRVVVTGLGLETPAGHCPDTLWSTVAEASGTQASELSFGGRLPVTFACQVRRPDAFTELQRREVRRLDRCGALGLVAGIRAVEASGVASSPDWGLRGAVLFGVAVGGLSTLEQNYDVLRRGNQSVSPFLIPSALSSCAASEVARLFQITGPSYTINTACASSATAVAEGARLIEAGVVDVAVVGGAEAVVSEIAIAGFHRLGALSQRNDEPQRASRPFDAARDGFVISEGSAVMILEERDRAYARGASVWGEILGYASSNDAYHQVAPDLSGVPAAACMRAALESARLTAKDVGHVNAHGTGTGLNDEAESAAIRMVFPDGCPVTATKGVTGHMLGASGALEAVVCLLSILHGEIPPVANCVEPIDQPDLRVVTGSSIPAGAPVALSNSFGFGGHNTVLVLGGAS